MGVKHSKKVTESPNRRAASGPFFHKYVDNSEGNSEPNSEPNSSHNTNANSTPNTEISPPESPIAKIVTLVDPNDKRANARSLAASLSLEEQVRSFSVATTKFSQL
jgi:beta-glucosidase